VLRASPNAVQLEQLAPEQAFTASAGKRQQTSVMQMLTLSSGIHDHGHQPTVVTGSFLAPHPGHPSTAGVYEEVTRR